MAEKLREIKNTDQVSAEEEAATISIINAYERDDDGEFVNIGTIEWKDDHWEPNLNSWKEWMDNMLKKGMSFNGKVYKGTDREFCLPLINSRSTAIVFTGE